MITTDTQISDEQLRSMTDDQLHREANRWMYKIYNVPQSTRDKTVRKVKQAITGKLAQTETPLNRRNHCRFSNGSVLWVDTREYELSIYRMYVSDPRGHHLAILSELSFIESDLEHLDGNNLAGFLAWRWTKAPEAFYYDRHKEQLRCGKELVRRKGSG